MARRSKEELMKAVEGLGVDIESEAYITYLEDLADSIPDGEPQDLREEMDRREAEWEQKYNELDSSWKKRYTERFFSREDNGDSIIDNLQDKPVDRPLTYDDVLYKKGDK